MVPVTAATTARATPTASVTAARDTADAGGGGVAVGSGDAGTSGPSSACSRNSWRRIGICSAGGYGAYHSSGGIRGVVAVAAVAVHMGSAVMANEA